MAKDINIHIKTRGAAETKKDLTGVAHGAEKIGDSTERMGQKGSKGAMLFRRSLKRLGFAAVAAARKIIQFYDSLKTKTDEQVQKVHELRDAYKDLFEATSAFDEKSRRAVTKGTNELLQKTGVEKGLGLSVINEYTRQFAEMVQTGQLTQEQYTRGLEGMLGYAVRHGGEATPDLIAMMKGWRMNIPEEQGAFRRVISVGAQKAGLTDPDVITALSRSMPTIQAMGWNPIEAVEKVVTLASGESGRKKMSLPATTFQAMMAPQIANAEKYGISEETAKDPKALLAAVAAKRATQSQSDYTRMLVDIYGAEAASGIAKLQRRPSTEIRRNLIEAVGPKGQAVEAEEERKRTTTLEYGQAVTEATVRRRELDVTSKQMYQKWIRDIGKTEKGKLEIEHPERQAWTELKTIGPEAEKEQAAYQAWVNKLSKEQWEALNKKETGPLVLGPIGLTRITKTAPWDIWQKMTTEEQWQALTEHGPAVPERFTQPLGKAALQAAPETGGGEAGLSGPQIETRPVEIETPVKQVSRIEPAEPVKIAAEAEAVPLVVETPVKQVSRVEPVEQPVTVINNYNSYDYGLHYYPSREDDDSGPRYEQI